MSGTTQTLGTAIVQGAFTANGNVVLTGTTSVIGQMQHTGDTIFYGNVQHTGNLYVQGYSTFIGNVNTIGASITTGTLAVNGPMYIAGVATVNNSLIITGLGNIQFNDNTIQTTAAIQYIINSGHINGAFVYSDSQRGLSLTSDATPTNVPSTIVSRSATGDIAVSNVIASTISTTVIGGNNLIAGSMVIYGNLQVLGTTTTVNAAIASINTKLLVVSNNVVSGSQADGSGIQVGNATVFADFLYDNTQTPPAWRSDINIVPKTNLGSDIGSISRNWGNIYVQNGHITNALTVGPVLVTSDTTVAQFTANIPSYSQIISQNLSSNSLASTDFVAQSDNGSNISNYIDIGINSSTYNDHAYTISGQNDGYVYVNGGELALGTQTIGKDVVFHTDGTLLTNEAGRIHLGRWILAGAVDDGVTKVQIGDNLRVVGNINAGNVNALNITSIASSVTTANTAMKGYVDGANTIQSGQISAIQSNVAAIQSSSYGNANVSAYLPTYTGNISAGNVTIGNRVTSGIFAGDGGLLTNIQIPSSQTVGVWTPLITFSSGGTATYTQHSGTYIKSGQVMHCYFTIQISAVAGASGTVRIGNLPVVSTTTTGGPAGGCQLDNYTFSSMPSGVTGTLPSASSYVDLLWSNRSGTVNSLTAMSTTNLGTAAILTGTITYISAS